MQELLDLHFLNNETVEYIFKNYFSESIDYGFTIIKNNRNSYYTIHIYQLNKYIINIITNILLNYYNSCIDLIPDGIHDKLDDDSDIYEVINSIKMLNLITFKI